MKELESDVQNEISLPEIQDFPKGSNNMEDEKQRLKLKILYQSCQRLSENNQQKSFTQSPKVQFINNKNLNESMISI